jgi:membrane protease YdiL (CAAX protease family)
VYAYFKQKDRTITLSNLFAIRKFQKGSAMAFAGLVILCIICRILAHYFLFPKEVYEPMIAVMHSNVTINLGDLVYQCLVPPLGEELLFRGLFLSILVKELKHNSVLAVFISAMMFAGFHPIYKEIYVAALTSGLIYSYALVRTQSVLSSIMLHALWNAFTFIPFP